MEFLSDEDLSYLLSLCEGRVLTTQYVKALVPDLDVMGDIGRAGLLSSKIKAEQRRRIEAAKKKPAETPHP